MISHTARSEHHLHVWLSKHHRHIDPSRRQRYGLRWAAVHLIFLLPIMFTAEAGAVLFVFALSALPAMVQEPFGDFALPLDQRDRRAARIARRLGGPGLPAFVAGAACIGFVGWGSGALPLDAVVRLSGAALTAVLLQIAAAGWEAREDVEETMFAMLVTLGGGAALVMLPPMSWPVVSVALAAIAWWCPARALSAMLVLLSPLASLLARLPTLEELWQPGAPGKVTVGPDALRRRVIAEAGRALWFPAWALVFSRLAQSFLGFGGGLIASIIVVVPLFMVPVLVNGAGILPWEEGSWFDTGSMSVNWMLEDMALPRTTGDWVDAQRAEATAALLCLVAWALFVSLTAPVWSAAALATRLSAAVCVVVTVWMLFCTAHLYLTRWVLHERLATLLLVMVQTAQMAAAEVNVLWEPLAWTTAAVSIGLALLEVRRWDGWLNEQFRELPAPGRSSARRRSRRARPPAPPPEASPGADGSRR